MQCLDKVLQACLISDKLLVQLKAFVRHYSYQFFFVRPSKWKKHFELINSSKDASRTKAIEMYPKLSSELAKKKM